MTFVRNDCRSIKRYAIFKFVTQFRLLRRECGHLWRANFHVDIQYSFMSYRRTFIDCLFFYSHSTNQLRNPSFFLIIFQAISSLVGIFGWSVCRWEMWSAPILCFFLTRDVPRPVPYVHAMVNAFTRSRHSFPHLWCQRTWWRPHSVVHLLYSDPR